MTAQAKQKLMDDVLAILHEIKAPWPQIRDTIHQIANL